jgi:hypothetical protein
MTIMDTMTGSIETPGATEKDHNTLWIRNTHERHHCSRSSFFVSESDRIKAVLTEAGVGSWAPVYCVQQVRSSQGGHIKIGTPPLLVVYTVAGYVISTTIFFIAVARPLSIRPVREPPSPLLTRRDCSGERSGSSRVRTTVPSTAIISFNADIKAVIPWPQA